MLSDRGSLRLRRTLWCWLAAALALMPWGVVAQDTAVAEAPATQAEAKDDAPEKGDAETVRPMIVHLHLTGRLTEQTVEDPFGLAAEQGVSLRSLTGRLHKLAEDDKAKALVLTFGGFSAGMPQLEELHAALQEVRAAGKPVYVFAESLRTVGLATLGDVDRLVMPPQAMLWLTGFYGEAVYLKDLLGKLGVSADFETIAEYKSGAEMLYRDGPSEAADENLNWLFDSWYAAVVQRVADARGMSADEVESLIDGGPYLAEQALEAGLIDAVQTREQFVASVKAEMEAEHGGEARINNRYRRAGPKANFTNPFALFSSVFAPPRKPKNDSPVVGIVYVEGAIQLGHAQPNPFGGSDGAYSGDIAHALDEAAEDDAVKAVVLRVDSPGGSAQASEAILAATMRVQGRKPLVVSMGNIAGSGGYYVACRADAIVADPTTITGSIGVISGKLVTAELWDKVGINFHPYQRGANADFYAGPDRFRDEHRAKLRSWMGDVYGAFTAHVEAGRGEKLTQPLADLAGGRVYTGQQALERGLVDELGGLRHAIERAAQLAELGDDYGTRVVPRPKDFFTQLMEQSQGIGERPSDLSLSASVPLAAAMRAESASPWAAVLSALERLDPTRAAAVKEAAASLGVLGRERVAVVMPFALTRPGM